MPQTVFDDMDFDHITAQVEKGYPFSKDVLASYFNETEEGSELRTKLTEIVNMSSEYHDDTKIEAASKDLITYLQKKSTGGRRKSRKSRQSRSRQSRSRKSSTRKSQRRA